MKSHEQTEMTIVKTYLVRCRLQACRFCIPMLFRCEGRCVQRYGPTEGERARERWKEKERAGGGEGEVEQKREGELEGSGQRTLTTGRATEMRGQGGEGQGERKTQRTSEREREREGPKDDAKLAESLGASQVSAASRYMQALTRSVARADEFLATLCSNHPVCKRYFLTLTLGNTRRGLKRD